jgi:hypothetical protein
MRSMKLPALALTGVLAVAGLAACGSDDSDDSATTPSSSTSAPAAAAPQATPTPLASLPDLSKGVSTAVTLDAGFVKGLTDLKVTPGVLGKATLDAATGTLAFPITGGNVTYYTPGSVTPYVQGSINHNGSGISLSAGGKVVNLEDFVVDPGKSILTGKVTVDGAVFAPSAPLFFLDGRTLQPLAKEGTNAVLAGTTVKLAPEAAAALNTVFGLTGTPNALPDYFTVGVAKITVATA